jgi:hypothetical protein
MSLRRVRRRPQKSYHHRLRLEQLEKRYALNSAPLLHATPGYPDDLRMNPVPQAFGTSDVPVGPVGTLVSSLIDSNSTHENFSDVDGDLPGIIITEADLERGTLHYSTDDGSTWKLYETDEVNKYLVLHADAVTRLAFSPYPGSYVAIPDLLVIKAWDRTGDYANGSFLTSITNSIDTTFQFPDSILTDGHFYNSNSRLKSLTFSADNETMYYLSRTGAEIDLVILDTVADESKTIQLYSDLYSTSGGSVVLSHDGTLAYAMHTTDYGASYLFTVDLDQDSVVGQFQLSEPATDIAISPDGSTAFIVGSDYLSAVDLSTQAIIHSLDTPAGRPRCIAVSASGDNAYIGVRGGTYNGIEAPNSLLIVDLISFEITEQIILAGWIEGVALSPDEKTVFVAGERGLRLIDLSTSEVTPTNLMVPNSHFYAPVLIDPDVSHDIRSSNDQQTLYVDFGYDSLGIMPLGTSFSFDKDLVAIQVSPRRLWDISDMDGNVQLARCIDEYVFASDEMIVVGYKSFSRNYQQPEKFMLDGFEIIGANTFDSTNTITVQRSNTKYKMTANSPEFYFGKGWRFDEFFFSLSNESSLILDVSAREVSRTINFAAVAGAYETNGVNNPTLVVRRSQTYTFNLNTAGHPFYLQTAGGGYQSSNVYSDGFTGNSQTTGEHQWVVPEDAPDEIFYQCEFHPVMFGKIIVVD